MHITVVLQCGFQRRSAWSRYLAIDNGVEWQTTWGYEVDQAGSGAWPMGALRWGPDMPDSGTSRQVLLGLSS